MQHKNYFISLLFLLAALTASAQTCPGPPNRTALINLQKSQEVNGTRAYQMIMTDTCGNQRYILLDSLIVLIVDSIAADTSLQFNWYTRDDTTTNALRTAYVLESAQWIGLDPDGFLFMQVGENSGGRLVVDTSASIWHIGLAGENRVRTDAQGVDITTSLTATRAVNLLTDTVNTQGRVDPTNFRLNFLSDNSYLFADSLKKVAIGQFPDFPDLNFSFFERGIFYDPDGDGLVAIMANGSNTKTVENLFSSGYSVFSTSPGYTDNGFSTGSAGFQLAYDEDVSGNAMTVFGQANPDEVKFTARITHADFLDSTAILEAYATTDGRESRYALIGDYPQAGGSSIAATAFVGIGNQDATDILARSHNLAFGVQQNNPGQDWFFTHLKVDLDSDDTTLNTVSLYGRSYYFANDRPSPTVGDTSFHFWAGSGTDTDPGFMTLDDIRDGVENWYNSNGTTTDNTRIADVLETATWRSDDVTVDGVVPFRFEIAGPLANEPEGVVIVFNNDELDSLLIHKSDQEIFLSSNTTVGFVSDERVILFADTDIIITAQEDVNIGGDGMVTIGGDSIRVRTLPSVSGGDIVCLDSLDSAVSMRTLKSLEGTFNADVLSWSAGAAGDRWDAVPANRSAILVTAGSGTSSPALSTENILVDGAGGGTISLDYTPSMPSGSYTTKRYIYNEGGDASVTVDTDQAWQFRDTTGDLGSSFSLAAGANAELIWIYNATAADARFYVILF